MQQNEDREDNTHQLRCIGALCENLSLLFRDRADVLVASDLRWYPKEGHPEVVVRPNIMVVPGRPPGNRQSYKQWEEEGVPVTVVFEVLSPTLACFDVLDKREFYEDHGVRNTTWSPPAPTG
jgi:Uma2 family endonuclease